MKANDWYRNYAVLGLLAGFVLVFAWIQLVRINHYLQNVEKARKA